MDFCFRYHVSDGVRRKYNGSKLFERTARAKDTDAMMMLSNIYRSQNQPEKSLEWLKKAAELGNKEAKQRLSSQP